MKTAVYIHGKGGSADEARHYEPFFDGYEVIGFDYRAETPREASDEFRSFFAELRKESGQIVIIANSIGAYFAMTSLKDVPIEKAYFISPVVNMERLITDMMMRAEVSESELEEQETVETGYGETLSWEYLCWVREHPILWSTPTCILCGSKDDLQSVRTLEEFADACGAELTVMEGGEHWFHTEEQMEFLDKWLVRTLNT